MVIGGVLVFLWSGGELLIYVTMATAGDPSVLLLTVSVFYPLRYDEENVKKKKRNIAGGLCWPIDDHIVPVYRFPSTTRPARPTM